MKVGITQIVISGMSLDESFALCKEAKYECIELSFREGGPLDINMSDSDIKAVRKKCDDAGIAISSVIGGYSERGNMLSLDPTERKKGSRSIIRILEIAHVLGVDGMLLHPGQLTSAGTYQQAWDGLLNELKELAPIAESHKAAICVENVWNKFLLSPKEMKDFVDAVGSEWVGTYLDTANMMAYGYPEHWVRELGSRIKKVHFKDFKRREHRFVNLLDGDTDWPLLMKEFRNIGYDSYAVHEVGGDRNALIDLGARMHKIVAM
ncbi:sugar phosphate isomerase/epimerase [Candidatus Poribacteria bacterium]|nr:sugar phosphate isomerase/epimerase [Candidatus Poribacteria bacterium]